MSAHWHIGMEVECIDDHDPFPSGHSWPLRAGAIYIVAGIAEQTGMYRGRLITGVGLILEGVPGCHISGRINPDAGFMATRFRPVTKRSTSISIFTQMLNPSKVDA